MSASLLLEMEVRECRKGRPTAHGRDSSLVYGGMFLGVLLMVEPSQGSLSAHGMAPRTPRCSRHASRLWLLVMQSSLFQNKLVLHYCWLP